MTIFFFLFCFFSSLVLFTSALVITAKNPVYSILFLILAFCNAAPLLFLLELEFLPVLFLIVYVGAISVLFLFVLMMLNIKRVEMKTQSEHVILIFFLLIVVFFFNALLLCRIELNFSAFYYSQLLTLFDFSGHGFNGHEFPLFFALDTNARALGRVLFLDYSFHFILLSYSLLFAMVGSIILTLRKGYTSKSQDIFTQILRDHNKMITFYL